MLTAAVTGAAEADWALKADAETPAKKKVARIRLVRKECLKKTCVMIKSLLV